MLDRIRSYLESFERDKVLVEQPGKRWDMSKSLPDDISYRREKWGLERAIEGARMSYDWFKHLPVVSTGSVLLITAVTKALFPKPSVAWLLVLALSAFMVSALASVFLMVGTVAAATTTPCGGRAKARVVEVVDGGAPVGARPTRVALLRVVELRHRDAHLHRLCCMERDLNVRHGPTREDVRERRAKKWEATQ